ncbi:hypothetical protein EJB05_35528, partial [Eragrostis curvula]
MGSTAEVKNPTWRSRGSNPGLSVTRRIGAPSLAVPAHAPFASALGSPQPAPRPAPGIKHYALRLQHRSYAVYPHYDQGTRQCKACENAGLPCCGLGMGWFLPIRKEISVVVRMGSYFSIPDGLPKTYCRRKTLSPIVVDASSYELLQLVNHIAEHFLWGSKQYISLWRQSEHDEDVRFPIKSDEQLRQWFELNLDKGVIMLMWATCGLVN